MNTGRRGICRGGPLDGSYQDSAYDTLEVSCNPVLPLDATPVTIIRYEKHRYYWRQNYWQHERCLGVFPRVVPCRKP